MANKAKKIKSVSLDQLKQQVEDKKLEIKAIEQANEDLAVENNIQPASKTAEPEAPTPAKAVKPAPVAPDPKEVQDPYPPVIDSETLSEGDKILGLLGYVHLLCIFPLILRPNSAFCQFHGKQGLTITLVFWGLSIVAKLFGYPWVADQIIIIPWLILAFYGIVMAFRGEVKKIPLFGDLAKRLNW